MANLHQSLNLKIVIAAPARAASLWRWAVAMKPLRAGEVPAQPPVAGLAAAGAR